MRRALGRVIKNGVQSLGHETEAEALQMVNDAGVDDGADRRPPTTASYSASDRPIADKRPSAGGRGRHPPQPREMRGLGHARKGSRLRVCVETRVRGWGLPRSKLRKA